MLNIIDYPTIPLIKMINSILITMLKIENIEEYVRSMFFNGHMLSPWLGDFIYLDGHWFIIKGS